MQESVQEGLARTLRGRIAHDDEIGIRYDAAADGGLLLHLPWSRALTEEGHEGMCAGAQATLLDTFCGIAAMAALDFHEAVATIDLRIDFVRRLDPGADCVATGHAAEVIGAPGNGAVLVASELRQVDCQNVAAYAFGRFIRRPLGNSPPGSSEPLTELATASNYRELMGFAERDDACIAMPFRPGLMGNGSLPSLHGGAMAAHLLASAQAIVEKRRPAALRVATANFTFLRFGRSANLFAKGEMERMGVSVASVRASSWQTEGRPNMSGSFTFVNATAT